MTRFDHAISGTEPARDRRMPESAFRWSVLLLFIALLVLVAFHHERWRDEAEAWLFARDADYVTIIGRAGYAGHTAPWFLLLAALAKSGAPYASIALLNGLFAAGAAAVVLWKAPFARITKLLFLFSYYPFYEYGVVARHYGLTMLMMFVVATLFPRRSDQPIPYAAAIFVLSNINVQGLFIGFALTGAHFVEVLRNRAAWKREATGIAVMGSGLLLAWLQLRSPPDAAITGFMRMFEPWNVPIALADAFFPLIGRGSAWAAVVGAVLILLVAIQIRRHFVPSMVLWVTLALFAYLWIFKWPGSARHHGFVLLVVFFVLWIARSERLKMKGALHVAVQTLLAGTLICATLAAAHKATLDVKFPFSGSKAAAEFIETNGLAGYPIAGHSAPRVAAVLPYLPGRKQIWFAGIGEYGSYLLWDQEFHRGQQMTYPEAVFRAKQHFGTTPYLLLLDAGMPDPKQEGFELLYASPDRIIGYPDERYYLYRPLPAR